MLSTKVIGLIALVVASAATSLESVIAQFKDTPVSYPFRYVLGSHDGEVRYESGPQFANVYELVRFELGGYYELVNGDTVVLTDGHQPLVLTEKAAVDQWGDKDQWPERIAASNAAVVVDEDDEVDVGIPDEFVDDFLQSFLEAIGEGEN
ncbi:hypothetical protein DICA3_F23134 [Diutina catenulata]